MPLIREMTMVAELKRLLVADDGQDLIEYALITASIGLVGIATWPAIETAIGTAYANWDSDTQDIWEVPDPS